MVMASELLGGRYELRGVLGRGGMAEVREGWDTRLSRAVAIKLLHPGFSSDADNRRRFEAEARSAAALSHPNIVAVHDSGEHEGTPFIVMERLPGRTVGDRIAQGPMPQAAVRSMLDEVLAALAVAHGAGILHRDIKPGNILFSTDGHTKVTDFGIAKTAEVSHTLTGQIVGTLAYLSPDRLAGKPATIADDLYAVGCVGYEALSGRRPFTEETLGALARAILDDTPPPLAALRPDVDPRLAAVIERAMARDPRWRFANAEAMRAATVGRRRSRGGRTGAPVHPDADRPVSGDTPDGRLHPSADVNHPTRPHEETGRDCGGLRCLNPRRGSTGVQPPLPKQHTRNRAYQHQHSASTADQQSRHHSYHRSHRNPGRATRERTEKEGQR